MLDRGRSTLWRVVVATLLLLLSGSAALSQREETAAEIAVAPTSPSTEVAVTQQSPYTEIAEAQQPLYIVREVVEVTSDHGTVDWVKGPRVIAARHAVLEGAQAPELRYEVSGLDVRVTKRIPDTTRVVIEVEALALRGDSIGSVLIGKGALESVRAEVFGYDQEEGGFAFVAAFFADTSDPEAFEHDLSALYGMPAATANVERVARELEKKVLAFYYNWYGSREGPSRRIVGWDVPAPHSPLMGPYDSTDETVIYAHMEMAKAAGIDGFIANWVGPGSSVEAASMPTMLRVAEQVGLEVSAYADMPLDLPLTHVTHPAWLKDSGRPVIFHYGVDGFGQPGEWMEWRRDAEDRYGPLLLIGATTEGGYAHVFDGFHTYIALDSDYRQFYERAIERFDVALPPQIGVDEAFSSAYAGEEVRADIKPFSLTVIPGYDDTPNPDRYPGFRLEREGTEVYRAYWETAIELDAHSVLITSWNEWLEGTEIEPSTDYGFEYLRLTRQFVEEYKGISLPSPEANYSATVLPLEMGPDLSGEGGLLLAADDQLPMMMVHVEVRGLEGVSGVDVMGDFRTYLRERHGSNASAVVPAVPAGSELTIRIPFTVNSSAVNSSAVDSPATLFDVSVSAYDPSGTLHMLIGEGNGRVEATGPSIAVAAGIILTVVALAVASTWLVWKWSRRRSGGR